MKKILLVLLATYGFCFADMCVLTQKHMLKITNMANEEMRRTQSLDVKDYSFNLLKEFNKDIKKYCDENTIEQYTIMLKDLE